MGEAIGYARNHWGALKRYVEAGYLSIDNNAVEQWLRTIALGRKNWLHVGGEWGGRTTAIPISLVQCCKLHGVEPWAYIRDVLVQVSTHPARRIDGYTARRPPAPLHRAVQACRWRLSTAAGPATSSGRSGSEPAQLGTTPRPELQASTADETRGPAPRTPVLSARIHHDPEVSPSPTLDRPQSQVPRPLASMQ